MKNITLLLALSIFLWCCNTTKKDFASKKPRLATSKDTIRIANDSLEYEIIIVDIGFNSWLISNAQPRGYYTQTYLESRNKFWVMEWNNRVMSPGRYNPNLYEMTIDYQAGIDYGYEVNYMLFNYLTYFQIVNRQRLGSFEVRR